MPTFSNVHAELDNSELHPPRDFSLAEADTFLAKNPLGDIQWFNTYWQRPILGFANASLPPITLSHGDRYILFGNTNEGFNINSFSPPPTYFVDSSIWVDTSMDGTAMDTTSDNPPPPPPPPGNGSTVHPAWGDAAIGDILEYYRTDNKDQPVYSWRAITPSPGYQTYNRADEKTYYFGNAGWETQNQDDYVPATEPQIVISYGKLVSKASAGDLIPGLRYFIEDRNMILTAVSTTTLGTEGDYTMALPAHGYVKLTSGLAGSINSISIDGQELLPRAIAFNTDLVNTASLVADAINELTVNHAYQAISIADRIHIAYTKDYPEDHNGAEITVASSYINVQTQPLDKGYNVGQRWFKVRFNFEDDWITEIADHKGNLVSCDRDYVQNLGFHPATLFPWAYNSVSHNNVINSVFACYGKGAVFANEILDGSILMANVSANSSISHNLFRLQSITRLDVTNVMFFGNQHVYSNVNLSVAGGYIISNTLFGCTLTGKEMTAGLISMNNLSNCELSIDGATINTFSNNHLMQSNFQLNQATINTKDNWMLEAEVTANGANFKMRQNNFKDCEIDISGASGSYEMINNTIGEWSLLQLQNAQGSFSKNQVAHTLVLNANNVNTSFTNNTIRNYTEVDLTDYASDQFSENELNGSHINLQNATCSFTRNQVLFSNVEMLQQNGNCTQNIFRHATLTSNNSKSSVNNNFIEFSTVKLSNTNGEFSSNKATYYSTYDLDGYLGSRVIFCEVHKSSQLLANQNDQEQGRIVLDEITTLDIRHANCIMYLSNFRIPYSYIRLQTSQIDIICTKELSTIRHNVEMTLDGILDLTIDGIKYGGIYEITNSGTLTQINGTNALPKEFILKAVGAAAINIDTSAAHIVVANGVTLGTLQGSSNHYVKISQQTGRLVITEAYTA